MTLLKGLAFFGCREDLANGTQYNRVLYPFSLQPSLPPPKNFIAGKGKDSGYGHRWGTEKLKGAMLEVGGECPGPGPADQSFKPHSALSRVFPEGR